MRMRREEWEAEGKCRYEGSGEGLDAHAYVAYGFWWASIPA